MSVPVSIQTIHVTYHPEECRLSLDQPHIDLSLGGSVEWIFSANVPDSFLPHVYFDAPQSEDGFEHDVENEQFGPFQYLEPSQRRLVAIGNTGRALRYPYKLLLLNATGAVATSSGVHPTIRNLSTVMNTSPDALIRYHEGEEDPFRVEPLTLVLELRRTAIWYIERIPVGHFVTFHFEGFQDPMTGPFLSFSLSQGFGNSWLANGAGFLVGHEGSPNPIQYHVRLRNALGTVVASDDPVIEPLGTPPEPPMMEGRRRAVVSSAPGRRAVDQRRGR